MDDDFLARPRLGMLSTVEGSAWARPVPVWFDHADGMVRMFSFGDAPKVAQLRADPRASLLATNHMDEPACWVSFTGPVDLGGVDAAWLRALAGRYWDLADPVKAAAVDGWVAQVDTLVGITLHAEHTRRYGF